MVRVERHPHGPRLHIAGQRVHHGAVGAILTVALLPTRRARLAGAAGLILMVHDRHDWRYWLAPGDRQRDLESVR